MITLLPPSFEEREIIISSRRQVLNRVDNDANTLSILQEERVPEIVFTAKDKYISSYRYTYVYWIYM